MNSVSPYLVGDPNAVGPQSNRPIGLQQPTYVQTIQQVPVQTLQTIQTVPVQTIQTVPVQTVQPVQIQTIPVQTVPTQVQSVPVQYYVQPISRTVMIPQEAEIVQEEPEIFEQNESPLDTTPIPEKKNKCSDWLLYLLLISFLITSLFISCILVQRTQQNIQLPKEALGMAQRVAENLKAQPISDIIIIQSGNEPRSNPNDVLNPISRIISDRQQAQANRERDVIQDVRPTGNINEVLDPLSKIPKGVTEKIAQTLPSTLQNIRQNPDLSNIIANRNSNNNERAIRDAMGRGVSENSNGGSVRHKQANPCPTGFVQIAAGQFYGVESGCLCEGGKIELGVSCMFKTGCKRVNQIDETPLKVWDNHIFCAKFTRDYTYTNECNSQQKRCSPGLCVGISESCPLTKLERTSEVVGDTHQIKLRDGVFFKKTTRSTEQPLIGLSITPGIDDNSPCFNENLAPKFESGKFYPLFSQPQKGCDSKEFEYHTTLDSQPEMKIYQENGLKTQIEALPEWSHYYGLADTFHLQASQRVRLGTSEQCTKVNHGLIEQSKKNSEKLYYVAQSLGIVGIVISALGLTFAIVGFVLKSKMGMKQSKLLFFVTFILAIVTIALAITYNYQYNKTGGVQDTHDKLQAFMKSQCFYDPPLLKMVKDIDEFGTQVQSKLYIYIQFFLWISVIFMVLAISLTYLEHLQYRELCLDPWSQLKQ